MVIERFIAVAIGYVFGLFETGYLFGKLKNTDIREHGSGNAGSTNALRVFGLKGGLITFAGDLAKSMLAIGLVWLIFRNQYEVGVRLLMVYAGLGAILGHNFPFYLNFNGGKGIACTAGFIIAYCPLAVPVCLLAFVGIVVATRYVSLGSLVTITLFFFQFLILGNMGYLNLHPDYLTEGYLVVAIITVLAFIRHRTNIVKLIHGNENKIGMKKAEK